MAGAGHRLGEREAQEEVGEVLEARGLVGWRGREAGVYDESLAQSMHSINLWRCHIVGTYPVEHVAPDTVRSLRHQSAMP